MVKRKAAPLELAMQAFRRGDTTAATEACERALAESPENGDALWLRGKLFSLSGDPARAIEYYEQAHASGPTRQIAIDYAKALGQLGQTDRAVRGIEEMLRHWPDSPDAYVALGEMQRGLRDEAKARAAYEGALELDPGYVPAVLGLGALEEDFGRLELAIECYQRADRAGVPPPIAALALSKAGKLLVRLKRTEPARATLERALELDSKLVDALNELGLLETREVRYPQARSLLDRAVALAPTTAAIHDNLGVVLRALGAKDDAEQAHRRAIELAPDLAAAHNNLGSVLFDRRDVVAAESEYQRAIELAPEFAVAYLNMGHLRGFQMRFDEAIEWYQKTLSVDPTHRMAYSALADALPRVGRRDEALGVYRAWLIHEPDSAVAHHMLAAAGLEQAPPRATDAYVKTTFDEFAGTFDKVLADLKYRAPQILRDTLSPIIDPKTDLRILDAGCGTGLCGPLFRANAQFFCGVDLSPKMLARARERESYDELCAAELTEFLLGRRASFDLILSADVFVYFGDLETVLRAAHGTLRAGGCLAFTVEHAADTAAVRLTTSGRYAHGESYVRTTLAGAGFTRVEVSYDVLRTENGEPVPGLVVLAFP